MLEPIDIEGFPKKPWVIYSASSTVTGEIYISKFDTKIAPVGRWYQINLLEPDSAPQHVPEISVTIIGKDSVMVSDFRPNIPKGVSVSVSTGTQTEGIPLDAGATKKTNGMHLAVSTVVSGVKWKSATFHGGLERSATTLSWDPRHMKMPTNFNHERSTIILERSGTQRNGGLASFHKFKNMRNRGKIVVQESPSREASPETHERSGTQRNGGFASFHKFKNMRNRGKIGDITDTIIEIGRTNIDLGRPSREDSPETHDPDFEHNMNHLLSRQSSPEPETHDPDFESESFHDPDLEPKQILLPPLDDDELCHLTQDTADAKPSPESSPESETNNSNLERKESPRVQHVSCSIPRAQRVSYFDNINTLHKSHYRNDKKKRYRHKKHTHHKKHHHSHAKTPNASTSRESFGQ